jgi:hypothetical protein
MERSVKGSLLSNPVSARDAISVFRFAKLGPSRAWKKNPYSVLKRHKTMEYRNNE